MAKYYDIKKFFVFNRFHFKYRYIREQAAQELAAVKAEPIESDSDMDENHYSPAPPEPESLSVDNSNSAQVYTFLSKFVLEFITY